jgi:hypothetical protein
MALLALLALLPCRPAASGLQPVARLNHVLAGQGFQLAVTDGGAAVLKATATDERMHTCEPLVTCTHECLHGEDSLVLLWVPIKHVR